MAREGAHLRRVAVITALAVAALTAGCGAQAHKPVRLDANGVTAAPTPRIGAVPWALPPDPLGLARKAGLKPEPHEFFAFHVHSHLDIYLNGKPVVIPGGIGIDIHNPNVRHGLVNGGMAYGGISDCGAPCISPLHTHDNSGILHTESQRKHPNELGQFFTEWNVQLGIECAGGYCKPAASVMFFVDGLRYKGDPRFITLTNHKEIVVVIGTPPRTIPATYDFTGKA